MNVAGKPQTWILRRRVQHGASCKLALKGGMRDHTWTLRFLGNVPPVEMPSSIFQCCFLSPLPPKLLKLGRAIKLYIFFAKRLDGLMLWGGNFKRQEEVFLNAFFFNFWRNDWRNDLWVNKQAASVTRVFGRGRGGVVWFDFRLLMGKRSKHGWFLGPLFRSNVCRLETMKLHWDCCLGCHRCCLDDTGCCPF